MSDKKLTVTLTNRPPVRINPDNWPVIASAKRHDGQVECKANTVYYVKVRQHEDGRTIVYGAKTAGNGGQYASFHEARAGVLLENGEIEAIVSAIHEVAVNAECDDLADDCIADLPAEELT